MKTRKKNRPQGDLLALASIPLTAALCVCASACAGKSTAREGGRYRIERVIYPTIHVRRPSSPPANPDAFADEPDYRSKPLPNSRFDCRPLNSLLSGLELKAIRECLLSLGPGTELKYELDLKNPPAWRLEAAEKAASCVAGSGLKELPVPREIVFQSVSRLPDNRRRYDCYAAGVDSGKRLALRIDFPLENPPQTDEQLRSILESWILSPFWGEDPDGSRAITGRLMADPICARCMGTEAMMQPWMTPPAEIDAPEVPLEPEPGSGPQEGAEPPEAPLLPD